MRTRNRLVAYAVMGIATVGANDVFAQSATVCSCLVPAADAGTVIGEVTRVDGNVRISQAAGYMRVKSGAAVPARARIMTGPQSSASLSVGPSCTIGMPANATVQIEPTRDGTCVSLSATEATLTPEGAGPGLTPILLGGGAVGGAAALILGLQDDDNSVSR